MEERQEEERRRSKRRISRRREGAGGAGAIGAAQRYSTSDCLAEKRDAAADAEMGEATCFRWLL